MTKESVGGQAVPLLVLAIGMIMEDEVDAAVTSASVPAAKQPAFIDQLAQAGREILALAAAAEVLHRRYS